MAVGMKATVSGNAKQRLSLAAQGIAPEKITTTVTRGMVQSFFPDLFRGNLYQWPRPLRGGVPLWANAGTHILSAFYYGVAGKLGWIRNGFKYAHVHDKGMTIKAKNERTVVQNCTSKKGKKFTRTVKMKVLAFKVGDEWVHAKSVKIPRRRFMFWSASATRFAHGRVENLVRLAAKRRA